MHEIMPETFEFCQFFKQVVLKWLSGTSATLGQARLHTGGFVPRGDAAVPGKACPSLPNIIGP